jgi:hypothetical protein
MPVRCVTKTIGAAVAVPVLLGAGLVAGPVLGVRGLHRARKRYGKKKAYARRVIERTQQRDRTRRLGLPRVAMNHMVTHQSLAAISRKIVRVQQRERAAIDAITHPDTNFLW